MGKNCLEWSLCHKTFYPVTARDASRKERDTPLRTVLFLECDFKHEEHVITWNHGRSDGSGSNNERDAEFGG